MSFNLSSTPFSSGSLWNQQVNTGATYTSINWPTSTGWNYAATDLFPVYVASSSDPVVQVSVPETYGWPAGTVSVHIPVGATGGGGAGYGSDPNPDNPIIVVDGDIAYNFWRFSWTSNTTATAQAYGEANVVTGTGWGALQTPTAQNNWSSVLGAGVSADGSSELGGLLVKAQTDTGTINHALQLAVDNSLLAPGYVAPAIGSDGYTAGAPLQEGQLLAIAPGTPMPSGLSPLGQEVFRALQQYGAYITERGGDQTALRIQQNAYDATTISALDADVNKFLPLLKAVSGGTPTTSGSTSSPTTPTVTPAVTQTSASPGTGTEHVGDTIALTLGFNEAVTVTGTPTLSLNDGGTATYAGGSGTNTLTFKTTVASTDTGTSALAITGVNLPSGAAIKDASGVAANLAGAVKTFSGLQIDPTSTTTPTTPTTPPPPAVATPVLTVADASLWVAGRGGTVDLGTKVTTTDSNDAVTVNITGLPKYETITDKLDGQTFSGKNITLTAAQVDSGLTLTSTYRGGGYPVATLTMTASAKDPSTGAVATASPQTITVTDPRPETTTTTSSHDHHTATDHQAVATTTAASQTIEPTDHQPTAAAIAGLASRGFAMLQQHFDPAASSLATASADPIIAADRPSATGAAMASLASQSFALLNQYLAAHTGQVDPGQIVAAVSQATAWGHDTLLARPQH
ncbi:hypothetical protein [Bradyrhizobium sp. CCBAU 53340]|uniref:hypothetical protein n=1 Tax=Bradyrhizobium sp. CCBAU 53340 TaxID=1325112 RepID=UPI00188B683D|nr:hypothetical protein [Bradyrhizobium sp. CCBAU 53340]